MSAPSLYLTPAGPVGGIMISLPRPAGPGATATILSSQPIAALVLVAFDMGILTGVPTALVPNTKVVMQYMGGSNLNWVWVK